MKGLGTVCFCTVFKCQQLISAILSDFYYDPTVLIITVIPVHTIKQTQNTLI